MINAFHPTSMSFNTTLLIRMQYIQETNECMYACMCVYIYMFVCSTKTSRGGRKRVCHGDRYYFRVHVHDSSDDDDNNDN
mmetsp:Transcript_16422/g.24612  ORF Transcript_16422/g.24612 Transcript_16422/m.24612 type:complete len:80 (-) Transcript_16422:574-813(-)